MSEHDLLRITRGGGLASLFSGLPLILIGIYFGIWQPDVISRHPVAGIFAGAVFALAGVCILFGRRGVIMDRNRRTVTEWWGLLVPFRSTKRQLGRDAHVMLTMEILQSKSRSRTITAMTTVFPVRLKGSNLSVTIDKMEKVDVSRKLGEQVAKFFNLPVHDHTGSEKVIRQTGRLDESIQSRARRQGFVTPLPVQPAGAVCTIRYGGPGAASIIEIPSSHMCGISLAGVLAILIGVGAVIISSMSYVIEIFNIVNPLVAGIIPGAAIAILFCAGLIAGLRSVKSRERITVSPSGVGVVTVGILNTRRLDVPAGEIEQIEIFRFKTVESRNMIDEITGGFTSLLQGQRPWQSAPDMQGIARFPGPAVVKQDSVVLRTDRGTFELGAHLERAEQEWLCNVLVHVLTSTVTTTPDPADRKDYSGSE